MSSALTDEQIALFTDGRHLGHFVTLMPDGSPHVSPVWIDHRDGLIWINTREGRVKPANVRRDPRVAVSVAGPADTEGVAVRGTVVELTHEGAEEHIDELSQRYDGRPFGNYSPDHPRVIIKIRPDHVTAV
jgi:PPOX class probable F420-dependent enzyme